MNVTNSAEWDHATGVARQVCARVFRDGGAPADALDAFGLAHEDLHGNWRSAVDSIAQALCHQALCHKAASADRGAELKKAA